MGIPLCVICCFSLAAFNICSLYLIFVNLINMCFGLFCLGFILFGTLGFLDLGGYFLPYFREVFNYYLLKYFLWLFFLSSGTPVIRMLRPLTLSQRFLRLSSFLLILFSFFLSASFISIFYLTYPIFCLLYSTVGSLQSDFDLIYCIIHYILTLFYFF